MENIYSVTDAARVLKVSRIRLHRLIKSGKLKVSTINKESSQVIYVIFESALQEYRKDII